MIVINNIGDKQKQSLFGIMTRSVPPRLCKFCVQGLHALRFGELEQRTCSCKVPSCLGIQNHLVSIHLKICIMNKVELSKGFRRAQILVSKQCGQMTVSRSPYMFHEIPTKQKTTQQVLSSISLKNISFHCTTMASLNPQIGR